MPLFVVKVNERDRPGKNGPFEAMKAPCPQGGGGFCPVLSRQCNFSGFPCTKLLTRRRAGAYIRAIDGVCFATSSCSFLLIVDVDRAFRGRELRRLLGISVPRLFDMIGRKRSADGGFFAVSVGFRPDGIEGMMLLRVLEARLADDPGMDDWFRWSSVKNVIEGSWVYALDPLVTAKDTSPT